MDLLFPVVKFLQRIVLTVFADWEVTGRENVPPVGPLIVVANHQSNFDPSLLATSLPRRVQFLAKRDMFRGPLVSWFLQHYGAFPLNREGADHRAYRWILDQLQHDKAIVVFPEGTRSRGGMKKALPGVASLALKSEASLLPVGITGTGHMGTWARIFNPTGHLRVNIGRAFSLPPITGKPSKEVLDSLTDVIMTRIAALLPPSDQGEYSIREQLAAREREGVKGKG